MSKTFEQIAKAAIKKLQKRKEKLENLMNDKTYEDLLDMRKEFKEEFKDYINEDSTFKREFWNLPDIEQRLGYYSKKEEAIFKRIKAQEKVSSNEIISELVKIDLEIGDLHTELFFNEKRTRITPVFSVRKIKDSEGDWYWIPEDKIDRFIKKNSLLEGKEYMDCPDEFDKFMKDYSDYKTGGDEDIRPIAFENYSQKINFI